MFSDPPSLNDDEEQSASAYENGNPTNRVKALLYTPKPVGMNALPMVVYLPVREAAKPEKNKCAK